MSKLIPLPAFLVPHFINGGEARQAVAAFQAFVKDFYDTAPPPLKRRSEYIIHLAFFVSSDGF